MPPSLIVGGMIWSTSRFVLITAIACLPVACGDDGKTSDSTASGTGTTALGTSTGPGTTGTSTTATTGNGGTGTGGQTTTGTTTGPGTTTDVTTGPGTTTTTDATTGTTGTGTTTGTTGAGTTGMACAGNGESCASGETCCEGLECCAGVPIPPGQEKCLAMCPISDRNAKAELRPVDVHDVLARVAALDITTWRYKKDPSSVRHLGPMAQDFKAAFGLGDTDKMIFPLDATGVSMAAIQALHQRLVAAEAENDELRGRLERLERRLAELEVR